MHTIAEHQAGRPTKKKQWVTTALVTIASVIVTEAMFAVVFLGLDNRYEPSALYTTGYIGAVLTIGVTLGASIGMNVNAWQERKRTAVYLAAVAVEVRERTGITLEPNRIILGTGTQLGYATRGEEIIPVEYGFEDEHSPLQVRELTPAGAQP